jgi:hypothetical protein
MRVYNTTITNEKYYILDPYFEMKRGMKCSNTSRKYDNLEDAKTECAKKDDCFGVHDARCSRRTFYHCSQRPKAVPKSGNVWCVYVKGTQFSGI